MTPATLSRRPAATEFAPYYARYIDPVPDGDVVATLEAQLAETLALLGGIPEPRGTHRYAPDKWSIKEVVGHVADTERIMSYRALRIARADATPLPGYEQDDYVRAAGFDRLPLAELVAELQAVRAATVQLLRHLDADALVRRGTANNLPFTVRALAYVIAGHELHHVAVVRERYLGGA
jgi:hypothetical protein